jgi:hypothetical protein
VSEIRIALGELERSIMALADTSVARRMTIGPLLVIEEISPHQKGKRKCSERGMELTH